MSQSGRGLEGVVPVLVHSLHHVFWGWIAEQVGCQQYAAVRIHSDNAPKISPLDVELKPKSHWSVRLGASEWARYTYERSPEDALELLGSARRGMQNGALAKLGDEFVLVVGDHVTPLSHSDKKQLTAATAYVRAAEPVFVVQPTPVRNAPPVVVVVKRRRIPMPH